ncbi:MAG: hypothetical protein HY716_08270 [Planctomycetes bacterium]|nr:hypothetical protein [Planctomycetota bacterium]
MSVKIRTEFTISFPNRPGELNKVLDAMAKAGVNVLAFCGWPEGGGAKVSFVPDHDEKARQALATAGLNARESRVVCFTGPSGLGSGTKLTSKLAKAGINLEVSYATTAGGGEALAVLGVKDVGAALKAIEAET